MGFFGEKSDQQKYDNGNVRDTKNPGGAKHAADRTVQSNLDAVRALRPSDHEGAHRAK
jgi:hypothetical protein